LKTTARIPNINHHKETKMSNMQYDKSSETSSTPYFDGKHHGYAVNPGRVNSGSATPRGGEVRRETILEKGGSLIRPNYTPS